MFGAVAFVVAAAALVYVILGKPEQFTLLVKGAPPNSQVFVDDARKGISGADGSIRIPLLDSRRIHKIRVECDGYAPFEKTVRGANGEEVAVQAALERTTLDGLPPEIDYHGSMVLVSSGPFVMGSDDHLPNERPAHNVTLPDYYIDKCEVTNRQYREFCESTGRPMPPAPVFDSDYFNKLDCPVVGVTWQDATDFARWAGKRLPTEEEWEKAASWGPSATEKRLWPWGNAFETGRGNIGETGAPTPVGQFPTGASGFGALDMAGNVAEWVDGYYRPYPGNTTPDPNYGATYRVIRGGTFRKGSDDTRTSRRAWYPPEYTSIMMADRAFVIGFRCAVSADEPRLEDALNRARSR